MKNTKFTKERMQFYAEQISEYCDSMGSCNECVFRDIEEQKCMIIGGNDKEKAPYTWYFE